MLETFLTEKFDLETTVRNKNRALQSAPEKHANLTPREVAVMPDDGGECCHVLVLLPGGGYFDGGNGVLSEEALLALHPGCRVEVMATFDPGLLDRRSGGLGRTYGRCPNYSDAVTAAIIAKHLALLAGDLGGP